MTVVEYKKFNMHVVTPHEVFMALEPEIFPWQSKIITYFNILLNQLEKGGEKVDSKDQDDIFAHEYNADASALAVIDKKHHELVPIFSS